jgi:uncharacterized protein HemX
MDNIQNQRQQGGALKTWLIVLAIGAAVAGALYYFGRKKVLESAARAREAKETKRLERLNNTADATPN